MRHARHFGLRLVFVRGVITGAVVLMLSGSGPPAIAAARYWAYFSGSLEIWHIGTKSIFDSGLPADESDLTGFRVTVDPDNEVAQLIPELVETTAGYGNHMAIARATALLEATDPFRLQTGDELSVSLYASGWAEHTEESYATSRAGVTTTLTVVNETDQEVFVDTIWKTCETVDTLAFGSQGESATANVNANLGVGESCWREPRVFRYAPHSLGTLQIEATAEGTAFAESYAAIPEPSTILTWGALFTIFVAVKALQRNGCFYW